MDFTIDQNKDGRYRFGLYNAQGECVMYCTAIRGFNTPGEAATAALAIKKELTARPVTVSDANGRYA